MAGFDVTDGIKKAFLIGVGALATGFEKSQELVEELVSKGELTLEQGKALNAELTRKVKETAEEGSDAVLRAHLKTMTAEEREAWIKRATKMAADLDAETVEVDVDEGVVEDEAPAEDDTTDEEA